MRVHLIDRRRGGARLLAVAAVAVLVASCSGTDPEQVEASQASPEPTIEPPPSSEPTEEPSESEPEEPQPTIDEDEPLYAPLPELTPDPENDIPDDIEQLILDAYADAYNTEFTAYATGEIDEDRLRYTHFANAFEEVAEYVEDLNTQGQVELSPDTQIERVWVHDFAGGVAVLRECAAVGERTGRYSASAGTLEERGPTGLFALDRRLELVRLPDEEEPKYRVTAAAQAGTGEP